MHSCALRSFPLIATTLAVAAVAALASCASGTAAIDVASGTVLQDVTVVDTRDGSLAAHRDVVLDGGKIVRIAPAGSVHVGGAAQAVPAAGQYLVPGFLDMHTHAVPMADKTPPPWPLLIANGITGIREMAGSPELIARAHKLNADSAAGRVDAPEVLAIPGPLIVGARTPEEGVQMVQQTKAMGGDFVKLISATHDASLAVLDEAKKQNLVVAGHLSASLSTADSMRAGWHSIEHLGATPGMLLDCSTDDAAVRDMFLNHGAKPAAFTPLFVVSPLLFQGANAPFYQRIVDTYSEQKCSALDKLSLETGTWQVPTLMRLKGLEESSSAEFLNDPNLIYVDRTTRGLWTKLGKQWASEMPASTTATFNQYFELQRRQVRQMLRDGVPMLAGSDLGGIWVVPGFSLHKEFRELASDGFTPLQVLQATTLSGATYLHREATMGTVEEGKNADLVLLTGNPIADAANLDTVAAVFLKGRYFPRQALDAMERGVADAYAKQPLQEVSAVVDMSHAD